jgi:predicted enzyme related to lactoylglutathione lyase
MGRAKSFYEAVFNKELMLLPSPDEGEMYTFPWEQGGANSSGALVKHSDGKPGMGGTMVYFQCDDVSDEIGRVAENGGTIMKDKMSIGEFGFIAIFEDTEGNAVGLHSES